MLADFDDASTPSILRPDVCVIGTGAAGITLGIEFDNSGLDVLLLAGGAVHHNADCQELYRSSIVGLRNPGIHVARARIHGGTTTLWAGQALPLDEVDFLKRDWVPHSGWPFELASLDSYYRRAERIMKLPFSTYDEADWPQGKGKPPKFDPRLMFLRVSHFTRIPNFAVSYRQELQASTNVKVLLNAHVVSLATNPEGTHLARVRVRSLAGRETVVEPRFVVVCCGAIETARLLLASDEVEPRGVGNKHDLVGRYFQEHLQAITYRFEPRNRRAFQVAFSNYTHRKIRHAPRYCATMALQREHQILNIAGGFSFDNPADSAPESAKLLVRAVRRKELRPQVPRAFRNVLRRPHEVVSAAYRYAVHNQPMVSRRGPIFLALQSEQQPNPQSRVSLGRERDALGMRRSVLDWRVTELDRHTLRTFLNILIAEVRRLDLGEVDKSSYTLPEDLNRMDDAIRDSAHHIGTTRMHDDPKHGVVDRDCRVHGIDNLFIGSSSVFPTGGSSNPTLTIIALCLRMADLIKRDCTAPKPVLSSLSTP